MGWRRKQRKLIISTTMQSLEEGSEISKPPQRLQKPWCLLGTTCPRGPRFPVLLTVMSGCWKALRGRRSDTSQDQRKPCHDCVGQWAQKEAPEESDLCNSTELRWGWTRRELESFSAEKRAASFCFVREWLFLQRQGWGWGIDQGCFQSHLG